MFFCLLYKMHDTTRRIKIPKCERERERERGERDREADSYRQLWLEGHFFLGWMKFVQSILSNNTFTPLAKSFVFN